MRLDFNGKQHIYGHHLTVPISPLIPNYENSVPSTDGDFDDDNMIIHGDNLRALKSLLPRYAGKIDCIYIDPPYNTGNEQWIYNDNVKSPLMKKWFEDNKPVDNEDLERHDKWLCMMWPRLHLLRELLSKDGTIFISIDHNEQHHLRVVLDEIFGEENYLNTFVWVNNLKGRQITGQGAAGTHENILAYRKESNTSQTFTGSINYLKQLMPDIYRGFNYSIKKDSLSDYVTKNELHNTNSRFNENTRPTLVFDIYYQPSSGKIICEDMTDSHLHSDFIKIPPKKNNSDRGKYHAWRWSREKIISDSHNLEFQIDANGSARIFTKVRSTDQTAVKDMIMGISTTAGTNDLKNTGINRIFDNPKPVALIKFLLSLCIDNAIILDSFAGSGTTAHATLALNAEDGGNRKFILVECEDYANSITAERVRRVINGVPDAQDPKLRKGYGGQFTYCTLGEPIEASSMLTGESLPSYKDYAIYAYHHATGKAIDPEMIDDSGNGPFYREATGRDFWLLYKPDLAWLQTSESALTKDYADQVSKTSQNAVVFASHKLIPQRLLTDMGIVFCQVPFFGAV
ncbi:site-specific DNA-methyltransferase [Candidatus Poriferisocius sp.]|uniref:site-specific DNA-methyltransferase n=1 Tax=Candidatus Poriferisocius sp. TaxID=3101276 RepID=UPI003B0285DD